MSNTVNVVRCKIAVGSRGCRDCGTEFSSGWHIVRKVRVQILKSVFYVPVFACADCREKVNK